MKDKKTITLKTENGEEITLIGFSSKWTEKEIKDAQANR